MSRPRTLTAPPTVGDPLADKTRIELEVEYVRREKVTFDADLDGGTGLLHVQSHAAGSLLRQIQFHMHHGKDMVRGEEPRLVRWRVIDPERICGLCGQEVTWTEGWQEHRARHEAERAAAT